MTCVCTDGKTMAADGRMVSGDLIVSSEFEKIRRVKDGSIVGCSGVCETFLLVWQWFDKGEPGDAFPKGLGEDFNGIILRPDGRVEAIDSRFIPYPVDRLTAIGSGAQVAMGALHAGRSARQAVEIAAQLVTTVGGRVRDLKPGRTRTRR